jgi:hypothetical protein
MRYFDIDTLSFTASNGLTYPVKDIRPIESTNNKIELIVTEEMALDEVASRNSIFGEFTESEAYKIFDANVIKLMENNFDLTKLKKISVPL